MGSGEESEERRRAGRGGGNINPPPFRSDRVDLRCHADTVGHSEIELIWGVTLPQWDPPR